MPSEKPTRSKIHFEKVAVVGLGLIGGSLALAMKAKGLAQKITGIGRSRENLEKGIEMGAIDGYTHDPSEGVTGADLVIVGTPVCSIAPIFSKFAGSLKKGAIVTDVGSVKEAVVKSIEQTIPDGIFFVGGHPIAGTEQSGMASAFAQLFEGRKCILTPTEKTCKEALGKVKELWTEVGMEVVIMDVMKHDHLLAAISHLPHMVAYNLVNTVGDLSEEEGEMLSFSAGGFKDFTRIASSDPVMWRDITLMNREALVRRIERYQSNLEKIKFLIESGDRAGLEREFARAKEIRDKTVKGTGKKRGVKEG